MAFDRKKGIAYCGLVCALCSENAECHGCRNEGCSEKEWCKCFNGCKEKGLNGCWECSDFPCQGGMLDKVRIRAFARFIKENSEEELLNCLERNAKNGVVYHHEGKLTGDYDKYDTEEEIMKMIRTGE